MFGCDLRKSGVVVHRLALLILLIGAVLSGCSLTPDAVPVKELIVEEIALIQEPPEQIDKEPVVTGLGEEDKIIALDYPWELIEQVNQSQPRTVPELLIRAINEFLDRDQVETANVLSNQLQSYAMTPEEQFSANLIRARITARSGNPRLALSMLNNINLSQIEDNSILEKVLVTKSEAEMALNYRPDAAISLISRDHLLRERKQEQIENQQTLVQLLQTLNELELSLLREKFRDPNLEGWINLADTLRNNSGENNTAAIQNWKNTYPNHPLILDALNPISEPIATVEYRQIALLLPLTSTYGNAAKAFYDGFNDAYSRDTTFRRPQVVLYDIGEEPDLSSLYYRAAINDGADFIIGPLGHKATDSLTAELDSNTATLIIADIPPASTSPNLFGINLSPEAEAKQVAERAFSDGHRKATVFRVASPWGQRVASAFVNHWLSLGGDIVKNNSFPTTISDYSRIIEKFLGLDKSIIRHRLTEAQAGTRLKFTPRRNNDMDFLFLAASFEQARLVVPQLRFFQAHDLPIYATSYVYSGKPEPGVDADLDGLMFGEMQWMLDGIHLYVEKVEEEKALKIEQQLAEEALKESQVNDAGETDGQIEPNLENALDFEAEFEIGLKFDQPILLTVDAEDDATAKPERPYQGTTLDRLYALGLQSYALVPRLVSLRQNQNRRFTGEAMTVSVNEEGVVIQHPIWARFKSGLPQPLVDNTHSEKNLGTN